MTDPGRSDVAVQVEVAELLADGEVDLKSSRASVGRQDDADARRDGGTSVALVHDLISIVDQDVPERGPAPVVAERNGIGQLMRLAGHRPFLRERGLPVAAAGARPREDVLEDLRL